MSKVSSKSLLIFNILFLLSSTINLANDYSFNEKKAIVIGASSGMGREVAKKLSEQGYHVGLAARRMPLLESLAKELPGKSYMKQIDVTSSDARDRLSDLITEMGGLDLIIISISPYLDNRISDNSLIVDLKTHQMNEWRSKERNLNVCANGFIAMADVAVKFFESQNRGHLVGISSTSGLRGKGTEPEYSAAKACISYYMEGIRNYMVQNQLNVKVTDVVAGFVAVEHSPLGQDPAAYWEITVEQAGKEIMAGISKQKKIVYVPAKISLVAALLKYMPDIVYNRFFPWM